METGLRRGDLVRLEFLKWVCLVVGMLGFITWLGNIIFLTTQGYAIHPLFEIAIGPFPFILILSSVVLTMGCAVAAVEKNLEAILTSRQNPSLDTIEKTVKELTDTTRAMEAALKEVQKSNEELRAQVQVLASIFGKQFEEAMRMSKKSKT